MTIILSVFLYGYRGKTADFARITSVHRTTIAYFLNHGKWDSGQLQEVLKEAVISQKSVFCIVDDTIASHAKPSSQAGHPIEAAVGGIVGYARQGRIENNIDKNNVIIMGHSLGGQGALYMAHHFNGTVYPALFAKCVVLSGYDPQRSANDPVDVTQISIPIIGYASEASYGEDTSRVNYMSLQLGAAIGDDAIVWLPASHGNVPQAAFTMDENGDNCSDLIQRCFDPDGDNKVDTAICPET